ncbi:MAG: HAD family hydrolase [Prevotella sp.]
MKDVSTYIFDLDGTLIDSIGDLASSCNYALRKYGMPEHSVEEVRMMVGNGVKKLMERATPDGLANPLFDDVYACFRQYYMVHNLDTTRPYPGIMEALTTLKVRNKKMAVVSNKFYAATKEIVAHFFGNLIDVAIGERENIRKKPAPDTVVEAMRQLGVGREGCVYVGDSDVDIETARNIGIPCISVLWGFRSKEFLLEHGASNLISSPCELY